MWGGGFKAVKDRGEKKEKTGGKTIGERGFERKNKEGKVDPKFKNNEEGESQSERPTHRGTMRRKNVGL